MIGKWALGAPGDHTFRLTSVNSGKPRNLSFRRKFKQLMMAVSLVASFAACIYPWINSFALMSLGIPTFALLTKELKR